MEYALGRHRGISWDRLGHSVFQFFGQSTAGTVSEDSFDYVDRTDVRVFASSSGTSEGMLRDYDDGHIVFRSTLTENGQVETFSQSQGAMSSRVREILPSSSTESDSETPHDVVFTSRDVCPSTSGGPSRDILQNQITEHVFPRRHSWGSQIQATQSSNIYSAHDEIHCARIALNVNPWARSLSENGSQRSTRLPITKQRSNSTPCYGTDHFIKSCNRNASHTRDEGHDRAGHELTETSQVNNLNASSSFPQENRSLFRHFAEAKSTRTRPCRKRRRPRNNPGHILEHDSSGYKDTQENSGIETESVGAEYRETTL
jgi:hypothetical protein